MIIESEGKNNTITMLLPAQLEEMGMNENVKIWNFHMYMEI